MRDRGLRTPEDRARQRRHADMTFGLILVSIGLMFLGERMHLIPLLDLSRLWPVILLVLGLAQIVMPREDRKRVGGITLLFVGIIFLLHNYRVLMLHDSWPLFIVLGGLTLILGRRS